MRNKELPKSYSMVLPGHKKVPHYVIGDPAYPLTPKCLKAVADPDRVPCCPELSQILQTKMIFHYIQVTLS